jgi:preprotein translocase subunit YajC
MVVTPAGMVMEVSEVAKENAESPMVVTPAGMVMEVSEVAKENA